MLSRIHQKLGTAGFIISIVALVAALGGGAYAAQQGLNGKQKKEVKKIAKGFQGKGPKGDTGPQGPAGPAGAKGDTGAAGTNGTDGTDGVSPVGTAFAGNQKGCTEGGVEMVGANTTVVCNGKKGPTGEPWTPNNTLPTGATETGTWSVPLAPNAAASQPAKFETAISFMIPLAAAPTYSNNSESSKIHFIWPDGTEVKEVGGEPVEPVTPAHCPGSVSNPKADSGHLCVYAKFFSEPAFTPFNSVIKDPTAGPETPGASTAGAVISLVNGSSEAGARRAYGTWAVTG